ncbi:C1 family peptidase [Plebeiibacterium sediminum]|uniref:Aminopeptidase n=1 Tax=Plebeiibacterium sediminum TaxID=2992112 RepID=A0AAE3M3K3_9BACT|nr:C1 family peptidase [Plebeiobacterium sediminum]MCW3786130.1 C1 family peptidase [Plebeiobacterium sediminum]
MKIRKSLLLIVSLFLLYAESKAQDKFEFETVFDNKNTAVKNQGHSGTCWAFSTISFIESEIIRMGGPEFDLSEMYIVNYAYQEKAKQYVMLHGLGNFSQGGQAHDVLNVIAKHGFVPESDFPGRPDTALMHNHTEFESAMKGLLDNYMKPSDTHPSEVWFTNIQSIISNYLGDIPKQTVFNKRTYSPQEFAAGLGIDKNNYIELTSYTHHPFYEPFDLEVPDNWSHDEYYNLPIDQLIEVMKKAIQDGYTIVWDGDVSEEFFSHGKGVALIPVDKTKGFEPQEEVYVTQEARQNAFTSWQATDDHLMHIVGIVKDQNGTLYFKTKNSWGTDRNDFGGYLYMSESYMRMNTVAIMLHKQALGKDLTKTLFKK